MKYCEKFHVTGGRRSWRGLPLDIHTRTSARRTTTLICTWNKQSVARGRCDDVLESILLSTLESDTAAHAVKNFTNFYIHEYALNESFLNNTGITTLRHGHEPTILLLCYNMYYFCNAKFRSEAILSMHWHESKTNHVFKRWALPLPTWMEKNLKVRPSPSCQDAISGLGTDALGVRTSS